MAHLKLNTKQWIALGEKLGYLEYFKKAQEEGLGGLEGVTTDMPDMPGDAPVAAPGDAPVAAPGIPGMDDPGSLYIQGIATASFYMRYEPDGYDGGAGRGSSGLAAENALSTALEVAGEYFSIYPFDKKGAYPGEVVAISLRDVAKYKGQNMSLCSHTTRGEVNGLIQSTEYSTTNSELKPITEISKELYERHFPSNYTYEEAVAAKAEVYMHITWNRSNYKFKEYEQCNATDL